MSPNFERGRKFFELSNHLGNVLVTVSDKNLQVEGGVPGIVGYYTADVVTANDYYPGGMDMPERSFTSGSSYRYGFNGKEKDNKDGVVQYDYGFRIYDPRLVRFKSVDPLTNSYPELTPYQFASNNPIEGIDLDGLEYVSSKEARIEVVMGIVKLRVENMTTVVKNLLNNYNADPKNWPAGGVGADFSVGQINFGKMTDPQLPSSDPDPGDANPNGIPNRMEIGKPIARSTRLPDRRFSDREPIATTSPQGARGLAYLQIASMALEYGVNAFIKYNSAIDADLIGKHIGSFKEAAADVQYALNKKEIPAEFQTQQYLSDITNVVLSGDSYVGKFDEATGTKLKKIGMDIYNTYSVKRKAFSYKAVQQTLGDGVTVNKTEVVPNPKYDAKYVAENPALQ